MQKLNLYRYKCKFRGILNSIFKKCWGKCWGNFESVGGMGSIFKYKKLLIKSKN